MKIFTEPKSRLNLQVLLYLHWMYNPLFASVLLTVGLIPKFPRWTLVGCIQTDDAPL
jgi:hypothetical protein